MKKIIYITIFLLAYTVTSYSLDTNVVKYYPMKLGNVWVTHFTTTHTYQTNHYYRSIIDSTILVNGHIFYRFKTTCRYISGYPQCTGYPSYGYLRIDSVNGNVIQYVGSNGCAYMPDLDFNDSLKTRLNDTAYLCHQFSSYEHIACTDTSAQTIFGISKPVKKFSIAGFEYYRERKYVKDIGKYLSISCGAFSCDTRQLVGCVINGVTYGDTSFITAINTIASEMPFNFYLYQNYPNPFNPVTTFSFDLSNPSDVKLIIYDLTGREIDVLADKYFSAGRYKVTWDGAKFASGVYFYTLKTVTFTQSKRMVLVK